MSTYNVAFVGTPNVGKSTILNSLIKKLNFKTGNWSGVTFQKSSFCFKSKNSIINFTDLPGIYNLNCNSQDELATLKEIISTKYDLYIQVIDGTDLNTGLYLSLLLKEIGINFVILINFKDKMDKFNIEINNILLERLLKTKIFQTCGIKWDKNLLNTVDELLASKYKINYNNYFFYNDEISRRFHNFREKLTQKYTNKSFNLKKINYASQCYIENNTIKLANSKIYNQGEINFLIKYFKTKKFFNHFTIVEQKRNIYSNNITNKVVIQEKTNKIKRNKISLNIDRFILNKWIGFPVVLLIILLIFVVIFNFGTPYKNFISDSFTNWIPHILGLNNKIWFENFLNNGIIQSFGILFSFIPIMYLLFIFISVLEQSGVISRISFLLNKLFSIFGLNGKSIVPLTLGFGCNVASVYATAIIENKKQKRITAMISPFMSCSARIVVFGLFTSCFFSAYSGIVIFSLYILGIVNAFFIASLLNLFIKDKTDKNSIIDLPPYQVPNLRITIQQANLAAKGYLRRAAQVIIFFSLIIWSLTYFPDHGTNIEHSYLAKSKVFFDKIFYILGFGKIWQLSIAIIPGIIAKEITVSTLSLLFNITNNSNHSFHFFQQLETAIRLSFTNLLPNRLFNNDVFSSQNSNVLITKIQASVSANVKYSKLVIYTYMSFVLLTIPCITTLGALRHKFGFKTMIQSAIIGLAVPYLFCAVFFQLSCIILQL